MNQDFIINDEESQLITYAQVMKDFGYIPESLKHCIKDYPADYKAE
jgi:oxalate decarboxylase/phosphoglucose isomerase-like protein (cupin superfamily)